MKRPMKRQETDRGRARRAGTAAVLGLVAALAGCGGVATSPGDQVGSIQLRQTPPERVTTLLAQSEEDLREGRYQNALTGFSNVAKLEPGNRRAQVGMGEAYLATGDSELALKIFDDLHASLGDDPKLLQGRGIALAQQGKADLALPALSAAVAADPSQWRSWNALGRVHDLQEHWERADSAYRKALDLNPSAAEVHNNLGYSLLLRGRAGDAARAFETALRLSPGLTAAQDNLALANALMGQYDRALAATPADRAPTTLNNVGFAALTRGDYGAAESYLVRAVQDSSRHFGTANENLRWLTYLRKAAPDAR